MRITTILTIILFCAGLSQCTTYDFSRRVRQQGNLLPQETIDCLKVGMSKEDVSILLGTSLLSPNFNTNRWDYVYTMRHGTGPIEICKLSLCFHGNTLANIEHIG